MWMFSTDSNASTSASCAIPPNGVRTVSTLERRSYRSQSGSCSKYQSPERRCVVVPFRSSGQRCFRFRAYRFPTRTSEVPSASEMGRERSEHCRTLTTRAHPELPLVVRNAYRCERRAHSASSGSVSVQRNRRQHMCDERCHPDSQANESMHFDLSFTRALNRATLLRR
jgi:hypothetical protein